MVIDGLRLAWGTLTAIPGPAPRRVDPAVAGFAMAVGWVVVLPVTLAASALGWWLVTLGVPAVAGGFVVVGALAMATRAIHADGLADTADGLGSGRPRDQALAIMKRGDVGPMGVVAVVLVYVLQGVLIGDLLARPWGWLFAGLALAVGRLALTHGCSRAVPAARADGLGLGVAGSVPSWLGSLLTIGVFLAGMMLADVVSGGGADAVTRVAWAWGMVIGTLLSGVVLAVAVRKLGGITGDVLGALVELMALGLLLGLALR